MSKGQARIALHPKRDFLIESLRAFKSLQEINDCLARDGVAVSLSSLYRFLANDMKEEYAIYLRLTGRGLVRNRSGSVAVVKQVTDRVGGIGLPISRKETISNPGELNNFLKNRG